MFPEGGLDRLVAQQPYLLMADVDEVVGKMEMCVWLCGGGGERPLMLACSHFGEVEIFMTVWGRGGEGLQCLTCSCSLGYRA